MSRKTSSEYHFFIPLSKWILSFQSFLNQKQIRDNCVKQNLDQQQQQSCNIDNINNAMSSADSFLIPALRLSCSLANEICNVLETETGRSPTPGVGWIDSILVYSQPNNDNLKGGGIEGVFDAFLTDDDDIRVEILPSLFKKTDINDDVRQVEGILHSLGIVFYELFSRGERPAELEHKQTGETNNHSEFEDVTEELSEDFDPFHDDGTADFPGDVNEIQNLLSYYNLSFDDSTAYSIK